MGRTLERFISRRLILPKRIHVEASRIECRLYRIILSRSIANGFMSCSYRPRKSISRRLILPRSIHVELYHFRPAYITFHVDIVAVYNIGAVQAADVLFVYSRQESTVWVLLCCKSCGVMKSYVSARLHAHGGAKPT